MLLHTKLKHTSPISQDYGKGIEIFWGGGRVCGAFGNGILSVMA